MGRAVAVVPVYFRFESCHLINIGFLFWPEHNLRVYFQPLFPSKIVAIVFKLWLEVASKYSFIWNLSFQARQFSFISNPASGCDSWSLLFVLWKLLKSYLQVVLSSRENIVPNRRRGVTCGWQVSVRRGTYFSNSQVNVNKLWRFVVVFLQLNRPRKPFIKSHL